MLQINTSAKEKEFRTKAKRRAGHHARCVEEILPIVVDAVFEHADKGSIYGSLYNGSLTGRSGWAEFRGRRIWGGYKNKMIEFRESNRLGRVIARFDNDSSKSEAERQIRAFRKRA